MSDSPLTPSTGDRWWRDFRVYGGATQAAWVQLAFVLLTLIVVLVLTPVTGCAPTRDEVVLYCAQDQVFAEPILAEFTRQTGIRVKAVFDSEAVKTVGLANRLLAERSRPLCDVFWGNEEFRTRQLAAAGVFRATNGWAAFGQRSRQLVVNTNLVSTGSGQGGVTTSGQASLSARPSPLDPTLLTSPATSLMELTNSRWRGKVSLAFPLFGTTATHFFALRQHWGESNWVVWCAALAANQPFIEEGNSHVVKRVARGEAWVGLTDSDDITAGRREGLPVAAMSLGAELLLIPNTVGLVAREGAERPAAEKLYEYLQTPAVQERLIAVGALEPVTAPGPALAPEWNRLLADLERATGQLKEIFRR